MLSDNITVCKGGMTSKRTYYVIHKDDVQVGVRAEM